VQLEREKLRVQMVMHYQETKSQEHQCILARHKIIEDRKEYLERLNTVRVGTTCHSCMAARRYRELDSMVHAVNLKKGGLRRGEII
jgi:hypothetical protein